MVKRIRMNISLTKEENALIKKLAKGEEKYEETQKEEKKRIQKDKIIGKEEDEEKEPEEENEYKERKRNLQIESYNRRTSIWRYQRK